MVAEKVINGFAKQIVPSKVKRDDRSFRKKATHKSELSLKKDFIHKEKIYTVWLFTG